MPFHLHATWLSSEEPFPSGHLFLWAENIAANPAAGNSPVANQALTKDSQPTSSGLQWQPGSQSANALSTTKLPDKIPSHSSQVSVGQVRSLLISEGIYPASQSSLLRPANANVWLPTQAGVPQQHQGIIQNALRNTKTNSNRATGVSSQHESGPTATLQPWQVTGLRLPPLETLTFLSHLRNQTQTQNRAKQPVASSLRRLRLGNELHFWSNAAKYILEILVGQHYFPGLRTGNAGQMIAVWQPLLLDTRIKQRAESLAQSMPPVCRGYNITTLDQAPTPVALLDHFMVSLLNVAIRDWASPPVDSTPSTGQVEPSRLVTSAQGIAQFPSRTPALHWMEQLMAASGHVHLPPQLSYQLQRDWRNWIEQLHVTSDTTFRVCFIIKSSTDQEEASTQQTQDTDTITETSAETSAETPSPKPLTQASTASWVLEYALQAPDDTSLQIPASEIWRSQTNTFRVGDRRIERPQERLLSGLELAGRFFAPIARSLRSPTPEMTLLSTHEAYDFLRNVSPLLESSGFGLVLPDWWQMEQRVRLGLRLRLVSDELDDPNTLSAMGLTPARPLNLGYAWDLTLGGERLEAEDFARLTESGSPLLQMGERWIELDPAQITAARQFLSVGTQSGVLSLLQAIRMAQSIIDLSDYEVGETSSTISTVSRTQPEPRTSASIDGAGDLAQKLLEATHEGKKVGFNLRSLTVDAIDVEGVLTHVLDQLRAANDMTELMEPAGFVGTLRPYQRRGLGWLMYLRRLGLGACLADDMGLGKTIQALALLLHVRIPLTTGHRLTDPPNTDPPNTDLLDTDPPNTDPPDTVKPALLICPTSVIANWRRETERFAPSLRILVHHGTNRLAGDVFIERLAQTDLVLTSYGTARRDIELLGDCQWGDLILDEAQNIKNPGAKQSQAVRQLQADNRIALTGTPVENRLSELWSIMGFLNPGYLDNFEQFRKRYIIPIERYNNVVQATELRSLVQPFLLRRLKSDPEIISDLPEKHEMAVFCTLTREQATLYEQTVQEALTTLTASQGIQRRGLILGLLTKLKQISNHPAHFLKERNPLGGRSGKLDRLTEMLEEALSVGDHALVFTQFVEMGHLLQRHLQTTLGVDVLFLHGSTSAKQRDDMVQAFQHPDGPPIFILSLRAGGSGLNLTRANHVFHFDRWWNPAVENQATDRAFRIGQTRNVQVHKFVVAGTLEERIHELLESKQALADTIVGSGEDWLTELDTDQLKDLLLLRRDTLSSKGTGKGQIEVRKLDESS
ncbi:MAG: DEAD/DEAH box helicase [Chloroflexota bacterium]